MRVIYDIETGPQPIEALVGRMPVFQAPSNYKDPAAIAEAIDKKKRDWVDSAALSAITGRVLCIGILDVVMVDPPEPVKPSQEATPAETKPPEKPKAKPPKVEKAVFKVAHNDADESVLLSNWWKLVDETMSAGRFLVSFAGHSFDLPFLMRRSWILGVPISKGIFDPMRRRFTPLFVDTREIWGITDYRPEGTLSDIGSAFGLAAKQKNGGEFARMWREDREAAMAYLRHDLDLTHALFKNMPLPAFQYDQTRKQNSRI